MNLTETVQQTFDTMNWWSVLGNFLLPVTYLFWPVLVAIVLFFVVKFISGSRREAKRNLRKIKIASSIVDVSRQLKKK